MYYTYEHYLNCLGTPESYTAYSVFQQLRSQLAEYVGFDSAYVYAEHITQLVSMKHWKFYRYDIGELNCNINVKQRIFDA